MYSAHNPCSIIRMATGVKIQSATYGVGTTNLIDVAGAVSSQVVDGKLHFVVTPTALNITDPSPGQVKTLTVNYTINGGQSNTITAVDGETIDIDAPPARLASGLQIVKAEYGYDKNYQDVTEAVRSYLKDGSINVTVNPRNMGIPDPNPNKAKQLKVDVKINGNPSSLTIKDGQTFKLNAPPVNATSSGSTPTQDVMSLIGSIVGYFGYFVMLFILFSITIESALYGETLFTGGKLIIGFMAFVSFGVFPIFILPFLMFFSRLVFG